MGCLMSKRNILKNKLCFVLLRASLILKLWGIKCLTFDTKDGYSYNYLYSFPVRIVVKDAYYCSEFHSQCLLH